MACLAKCIVRLLNAGKMHLLLPVAEVVFRKTVCMVRCNSGTCTGHRCRLRIVSCAAFSSISRALAGSQLGKLEDVIGLIEGDM